MYCIYNLKILYEILNKMKFNLLCDKNCNYHEGEDYYMKEENCHYEEECGTCKCNTEKHGLKEVRLIRKIVEQILVDSFCTEKLHGWDKDCNCMSLIDALMITLYDIEECTYCKKNYGYLLQIDKFECILKNLKNLLCQLKCLSSKDCDLISKALCDLLKIIDLIESIISKINNIECLCDSHLYCKCELLECIVCELEDEINCLEKTVANLAYIVFEIASKEILNCTTCGVSEYVKDKKRDYLNKYCKAYRFNDEKACNKKY